MSRYKIPKSKCAYWTGKKNPNITAEKHPLWKGNDVGYHALHQWVRTRLPKPGLCQICNKVPPHDMANISGRYLRDLKDWQYVCRKCHMLNDGRLVKFRSIDLKKDLSFRQITAARLNLRWLFGMPQQARRVN